MVGVVLRSLLRAFVGHDVVRKVPTDAGDKLGARLACLVNASVTVCRDDSIIAFGGFDQYTDEGMLRGMMGEEEVGERCRAEK
jgi:hypothetical protein